MSDTRPPTNTLPRRTLAGLLIATAAGGAYWWVGPGGALAQGQASRAASGASAPADGASAPNRRSAAMNRVQPVTVGTVVRRDLREVHLAIGNMAALNTAVVRTRVDGELRAIRFKEGQQVRAGQLLAEIDPRAFQAQLAQAEGQLARDQALLRNAQLDMERYKDLATRDAIARQQVDTQEALVRQLQGTLRMDQAAVDNARLSLSYTKIVAPIGGQLGLKLADLGNIVRASDAAGLVSITQTDPISVVFSVPEALLPRVRASLREGHPPAVEAWDREQRVRLARGAVKSTDNAIDAVTGTIRLKAEFPNADGDLFPNQFVNVRLLLGVRKDALAAPATAVQRSARGSFVYLVKEDGTVGIRPVRTGVAEGDWIELQADLKPGDRLVTDGADRLREGSKVEVVTPPRPAPAAAPAPDTIGEPKAESKPEARPATSAEGKDAKKPASKTPKSTPARPSTDAAPPAPSTPSTAPAAGERPPWLDRLPPEVQQRFLKMNAEERQRFIEQLRERRRQREQGGG